jgi:hypothetical protein
MSYGNFEYEPTPITVLHEKNCPADHDCNRDHPDADVYHFPQLCTCPELRHP